MRRPTTTSATCTQCGFDSAFHQKQNRRLREKLEYSELQNLKLTSENRRLRKELLEAEFKGRSSVSKPHCPVLPNELLQDIFSFATHVEGNLVSPHWRIEDPYIPWVISSQARRSIPLVCRQWYNAGLQYLYEHIVIFNRDQVYYLFDNLSQEQLNWIRGLEFILLRDQISIEHELAAKARMLIRRLPQGRLRVFGFEHGQCSTDRNAMEIVTDGIEASEGSLESLHMPCLREHTEAPPPSPPPRTQPKPRPRPDKPPADKPVVHVPLHPPVQAAEEEIPHDTQTDLDFEIPEDIGYDSESEPPPSEPAGFTGFSKLQTLSLTSGRWEPCGGSQRATQDMISVLADTVHSIHTVYLNWLRGSHAGNYIVFLSTALNLHTIHVIIGRTPLLIEDLDVFLQAVPQVRRLVITPSDKSGGHIKLLARDDISHQSLEEIVLKMQQSFAYKTILILNPIFCKIKSGHLSKLRRVVVRGPYPEGCIDDQIILPARYAECWDAAITACAEQEVDFVNEDGDAIHLWNDRHRIAFEETDTDSDDSIGSRWWETGPLGNDKSSIADEDDAISNDSDDSPYRYVTIPDLDYDTDSDASKSLR